MMNKLILISISSLAIIVGFFTLTAENTPHTEENTAQVAKTCEWLEQKSHPELARFADPFATFGSGGKETDQEQPISEPSEVYGAIIVFDTTQLPSDEPLNATVEGGPLHARYWSIVSYDLQGNAIGEISSNEVKDLKEGHFSYKLVSIPPADVSGQGAAAGAEAAQQLDVPQKVAVIKFEAFGLSQPVKTTDLPKITIHNEKVSCNGLLNEQEKQSISSTKSACTIDTDCGKCMWCLNGGCEPVGIICHFICDTDADCMAGYSCYLGTCIKTESYSPYCGEGCNSKNLNGNIEFLRVQLPFTDPNSATLATSIQPHKPTIITLLTPPELNQDDLRLVISDAKRTEKAFLEKIKFGKDKINIVALPANMLEKTNADKLKNCPGINFLSIPTEKNLDWIFLEQPGYMKSSSAWYGHIPLIPPDQSIDASAYAAENYIGAYAPSAVQCSESDFEKDCCGNTDICNQIHACLKP